MGCLGGILFVELLVDPGEETLEDGFRLFLPACELGLSRRAVVTNLLLDLVESGNMGRAARPWTSLASRARHA
jgi:hypothetical protein